MENFSESFFLPTLLQGIIPAPTGDGTEAFVSADDIAAVAAATLAAPDRHAGAHYAPTGPDALSMTAVAEIIGRATSREIQHIDVPREAWVQQTEQAGVPAPYARMLGSLFDTIAAGDGARPNADIERATGKPPTSFETFAKAASSTWRQTVAS